MIKISIIEVKALIKIFSGAATASIQGIILLAVARIMGAFTPTITLLEVGAIVAIDVMLLITSGFVGLGVAIGSTLNDFHAFQLLSAFVMWPLLILSEVFFPIDVVIFSKFREFKPRPIHGLMVARDSFEYRFKISELRPNSIFFQNMRELNSKMRFIIY